MAIKSKVQEKLKVKTKVNSNSELPLPNNLEDTKQTKVLSGGFTNSLVKNVIYLLFIGSLGLICYMGYLCKESLSYRNYELGSIATEVDSSKFVPPALGPTVSELWSPNGLKVD